jgi:hypothetical protein
LGWQLLVLMNLFCCVIAVGGRAARAAQAAAAAGVHRAHLEGEGVHIHRGSVDRFVHAQSVLSLAGAHADSSS